MKNNINLDISKIHTYCKQTHMYATRQVFKINKKRIKKKCRRKEMKK